MTPTTARDSKNFLAIREFLTSYITFPEPVYADMCALWAMGTHVYREFDAFGYLVITASTKRAGKTILAELLGMVCKDAKNGTSMTASVMRRLVAKGSVIMFDEAESLNSEAASAQREYLNIGYRAGQSVFLPGAGPDEVIEYPAYSPKAFILIGDVNDTLRDRSIVVELRRAKAPKGYRRTVAEAEAAEIHRDGELTEEIAAALAAAEAFDAYEVFEGREAEVWTAVLTMAKVFAPSRFDAVVRMAVDMGTVKNTTEKRRFSEIRVESEHAATVDSYSERAMRDLASVFKHNEARIHTKTAIERMKEIATGPWRTYKGEGLTPVLLSDLVNVFHVKTRDVKISKIVSRGFQRADVMAGLKRLTKHSAHEV